MNTNTTIFHAPKTGKISIPIDGKEIIVFHNTSPESKAGELNRKTFPSPIDALDAISKHFFGSNIWLMISIGEIPAGFCEVIKAYLQACSPADLLRCYADGLMVTGSLKQELLAEANRLDILTNAIR